MQIPPQTSSIMTVGGRDYGPSPKTGASRGQRRPPVALLRHPLHMRMRTRHACKQGSKQGRKQGSKQGSWALI